MIKNIYEKLKKKKTKKKLNLITIDIYAQIEKMENMKKKIKLI